MAATGVVTLANLRQRAQYRADMVNSGFVTDAEWNSYITNSYKELYNILITAWGENYYVSLPWRLTTVKGQDRYDLPDGTDSFLLPDGDTAPAFYHLLGVDLVMSPGTNYNNITLKQFNFQERNKFANAYAGGTTGGYGFVAPQYKLIDHQIMFRPVPNGGSIMQLWYVPRPTDLVTDSDTVEGIAGWDNFIVIDAARQAMEKEESDTRSLVQEKAYLIKEINRSAVSRDAGSPATVTDVYANGGWYGGWN